MQVMTRRDASGSDDALHGANWDKRTLLIKDARKVELTLQKNGFQLMNDPKARHVDYYDEDSVISRYYRECEELLLQATGAKLVRAFDHNVRSEVGRSSGRKLVGGNAVQGPAALVHGDYTAASAPRRLSLLGQAPKLNDPLRSVLGDLPVLEPGVVDDALSGRRRFAFINVWRPIRPVQDKHLACADAATVRSEDLITFQIVYPDRVGENYFAKWRPRHDWYYYPGMTPDEVLFIKQWDSRGELTDGGDAGTSTFSLHSAFRDPTAAPDAPDRESIEVRLVAVF